MNKEYLLIKSVVNNPLFTGNPEQISIDANKHNADQIKKNPPSLFKSIKMYTRAFVSAVKQCGETAAHMGYYAANAVKYFKGGGRSKTRHIRSSHARRHISRKT